MAELKNNTSTKPYVRPGFTRLIADMLLWVGIMAAISGIAFTINGITQANADVDINVVPDTELTQEMATAIKQTSNSNNDTPSVFSAAGSSELRLEIWDSTALEQFLSRGGSLVFGFAVLAAGILLQPVLFAIAEGEPFKAGIARRIALLSAVVAVASLTHQLPGIAAANRVLERVSQAGDGLPATALPYELPVTGLFVALGLLIAAEAFRRGSALADDVRGLV